jgi:hypothetical protein
MAQTPLRRLFTWLLLLASLVSFTASAETSLCARVSIQIEQQLALERQGFDAHMCINKGMDTLDLQNVAIDVLFTDQDDDPVVASSDPANTEVLFFIRLDSLSGIDDIGGSGTIAPNTSADIHWFIVPASGAGGQTSSGEFYYVGATLRYTLGDEENVTEVTPDFIYVKPMPLLTLDYFLTQDVYADDVFTPEIEPPEPFTLGVRVTNSGQGVAHGLRIESAQPRIVDNQLGLLINFQILAGSVNDSPATASLLLDFGDVDPNASTMGRWTMQTTLSGEFVEFDADLTRADELGGELTSLLEATNTHFLVHDVRVDLPGRGAVRDFLAKDGDVLRVCEFSGLDTVVTDQSADSALAAQPQNGAQLRYSLSAPAPAGFMYGPFAGSQRRLNGDHRRAALRRQSDSRGERLVIQDARSGQHLRTLHQPVRCQQQRPIQHRHGGYGGYAPAAGAGIHPRHAHRRGRESRLYRRG